VMIEWSTLILNVAWPILMAYSVYRVVLAMYARRVAGYELETVVAGLGGAIAWWGRTLYAYDLPLDWPFALTVLGVSLMLVPKIASLTRRDA